MPRHTGDLYRLSLALLGAGVLSSQVWADPVRLKIILNGSAVGSNTYEISANSSFSSETKLDIGTMSLGSTITGRLDSGKLVQFELNGVSPAGKTKMTLSNGQIEADVAGKKTKYPFVDKTGILFGSLHPQFSAIALLAAEKVIKEKPGTDETTLTAFLIDGGTSLGIKVRSLPSRKVKVAGQERAVRRFTVSLGAVEVEYALDDANEIVGMDVPTQKLRMLAEGWDALYVDPLAKYPELSQPTFSTQTLTSVKMKTRDGVQLSCDIVKPNDNKPHPTILVRTPYGKVNAIPDGGFWASRGYCYVAQDCRGREESDGEWDPFIHEGQDGYDTIQWISKQPWSDGKVGMIGGSYGGYVQWAAAVQSPPALKCIVPQVSPPDAMRNLPYEYGIFYLYADLWWSKIVAGKKTDLGGIKSTLSHPEKLTTLPLQDIDQAVLGEKLDFFQKWLSRDSLSKWKGWDYTDYMAKSRVPALHISGTWDGDGIGTALNWEAMRKLGRKDQWIIFGPWIHAFNTTHALGDTEYGPQAILELDSVYLRWFDTWLKNKKVGLEKTPHVKLFVTGANKWIEPSNWPSPDMQERTIYLAKSSLVDKPNSPETRDYVYDPAVDTKIPKVLTGSSVEDGNTKLPAESLQAKTTIFLTSAPMKRLTAITGPVTIKLHFTSSAVNTDFIASIVDVSPDGVAHVVGMPGKLRAAYLNGNSKPEALVPNKEYVATLHHWQFAHEFGLGHRLGLVITSSGFPMFARNLGTMDPIKTATRMVSQHNTILMGKGHESSVSFHVIWEK